MYNLAYQSSVDQVQVLNSHVWLVATVSDGAHMKHFHHNRKFC